MKNKFLKRFFILFLLCTVVTVSVHTQYKTAQADALVLPMVVKAGASLLGLSVGGLLGTVIGGVALLYGTYYVIDNWNEITVDVHNALNGASGAVAEWYDGITSSAVHKDDPVYKMKDKIEKGEVINPFDYRKPKEPDRKIEVTPAVIKFIKERLDKTTEKLPNNNLTPFDWYEEIMSRPNNVLPKSYILDSPIAVTAFQSLSNNNYIIEFESSFFASPKSLVQEFTKEFKLSYDTSNRRIKYILNMPTTPYRKWDNGVYANWYSERFYWNNYNEQYLNNFEVHSMQLTQEEHDFFIQNGRFNDSTKITIINRFKDIFKFTNFLFTINDSYGIFKNKSVGGRLYDKPIDYFANPQTEPQPIEPINNMEIFETEEMLQRLDQIDLTSKNNTKELSDELNNIKEILDNLGEPSINISAPSTPPFDASEINQNIKDLPNQIRDNSKGLIDDALSTDNLDLPSNVQPLLDTLDNRLSILSYPMSLLIQIITRIIYSNQIDCILHFPPLKVFGTTFYNGTSFNFTAFFRQEPFIYIRYLTQLFTSAYFTFQLFGLFKRKLDEIIKGGAGYNS